jgi:alpha-L-fucosidase
MTMNDHWGFNRADQNWKSAETLIRNLIDTASKGGNYLLNVGPTASGEFPPESVERLEAIGRWMDVNAESIYGTSAGPVAAAPWGRCTKNGSRLYLHVFDWPGDGRLVLDLPQRVSGAHPLSDPGIKLKCAASGDRVTISLPAQPLDPIATVVAVDVAV